MDVSVPKSLLGAAFAIAVLFAAPAFAQTSSPPYRAQAIDPSVHRVHQAYYAMPHNTYEHGASLTGWLDQGFRAVELDIVDIGDWERDPEGPYVSHGSGAGNHNCSGNPDRLGHCLRDIVTWLDSPRGKNQGPVLVYVDMKSSSNFTNDWKADEVRMLDDKIHEILGVRMFTGSDLFRSAGGIAWSPGTTAVRSVVSQNGWPLLSALSDRVIVAYTGGRLLQTNQTQGAGIENILATHRRLPNGFFCPDVESTPQQLAPGGKVDGVSYATSQYFVCSNLKARDHYQIVANASHAHKQLMHIWNSHVFANDSYAYNYIAIAHGISAIGRDGNVANTWGNVIPLVGVRRSLPGYFELRPAYAPTKCMDANGNGTRNGTGIILHDCHGGANQRFVYTAEGQLRPRHANRLCTDISGGRAGSGKTVHLWDCDGGASEKWTVDTAGHFRNVHNGGQYCLAVQNGSRDNGTRFVTAFCSATAQPQIFQLHAVPDWPQSSF